MNSNYLQNLAQDLQTLLSSDSFQKIERDLMGENLLSQFVPEFDSVAEINVNQVISLAHRIEQIAIRLWENEDDGMYNAQATAAFERAAKLFEYIAETQNMVDAELTRSLYFHSPVNFSLGEFQANAVVIARKALARIEFTDSVIDRLFQACFLLLQKRITQIQREFKNLVDLRQDFDTLQEDIFAENQFLDKLEDIAHFLSAEAVLSFSRYLQSGTSEDLDKARTKIKSSLD